MSEHADDGIVSWYDGVAAALREKPPADVARELSGLVDILTDDAEGVDHYAVGVSFTKDHGCLDYAVDRVMEPEAGGVADGEVARADDRVVESVKPRASENHHYVGFDHPPDPHFDAAALRARLLGAVHRERQEAADVESNFADLWEQL